MRRIAELTLAWAVCAIAGPARLRLWQAFVVIAVVSLAAGVLVGCGRPHASP